MQLWRPILLLFVLTTTIFSVNPIDLTFAVPAVAIIVGIFLATAGMLSHAISDPKLDAWIKIETREFVAALLLIAIIMGLFFTVTSNSISIALTGDVNYIQGAENIADQWLEDYDNAFEKIVGAATRIRASATYSPYMSLPLWYVSISYSTSPIAGVGIVLGSMNIAAQNLANVIFVTEGVRMLLSFIKITAPKILLPLALCLRIIPFTRKTGNTLIALAVAGIVLLPFSVILAESMNQTIDRPEPSIDLSELEARPWAMVMMEPLCESTVMRTLLLSTDIGFALIVCLPMLLVPVIGVGLYTACYNLVKEVVYPLINMIFQLVIMAVLIIWEAVYSAGSDDYANQVFNALYPFLRDVGNLVFLGYLDIILIGIITIAGARSISGALGGEWYMAGIQRLI
ncbi:hypothetical protein KKF81_01280 [Candidatus Micrarchaeota archaeon]|nr:hypothetical protein [Candidatus Micrarchaeota archaeon]MBU1165552.1 hypothetical protein [Candidatus Micrarchaeota archaeon]MBU1886505.1 hypothetical protein [Candidatus Micrarchaeota archaeon]